MTEATQARVNIRCRVNSGSIRKATRNGRAVVIVPSATLPDNVVMNGVKYPAEEIERGFASLERTPAPLGHPMVNGEYVSANDPEGLNVGWIGAWNENVRRSDGRVHLDKIIDVEVAKRSEGGKRVLEAINTGKPIHTSTGVLLNLRRVENESFEWVASDLLFDHDAILLDEEGAATPDQGVGMMVNKKGEDVMLINSRLEESLDEQLDWAVDSIVRTLEQRQRLPMLERIKATLMELFSSGMENDAKEENADMANENDTAAFEGRFNAMEASVQSLTELVTSTLSTVNKSLEVLPTLVDKVNAMEQVANAAEAAAKVDLVNKVVEAGLLTKANAETLGAAALKELVANRAPKTAFGLNSAFTTNSGADDFADYDFNAHLKGSN